MSDTTVQRLPQTQCPACLQSLADSTLLKKLSRYELRLCRFCGLRYSFPMIHPGVNWYEKSPIYQEVEWNVPSPKKLMTRWEFQKFFEQRIEKGALVYDIGCGRGDFLALARSKGFRVSGMDINQRLIELAKQVYGLVGLHNKAFEDISLSDLGEKPDAITAFEVMEHVADPNGFLQRCHHLLNDGGLIVLSIPGYHRWPHWVNSDVDTPPHHLTLWSEKALRVILQKNRFIEIVILRKPLLLTDLMYHVVRVVPGALRPNLMSKIGRGGCKLLCLLTLLCLRWWPHSGGFTLMGIAKKGPSPPLA